MPNPTDRKRSRSAEYAVAIPLLLVCVVVGLAVWLLKPGGAASQPGGKAPQVNSAGDPSGPQPSDETAAVADWNRRLQADLSQAEQQRRQKDQREADATDQKKTALGKPEPSRPAPASAPPALPTSASAEPPPQIAAAEPVPASPKRTALAPVIDWTTCREPEYPSQSIDWHEEGVVTTAIDVDAAGRVLGGYISKSSGFSRLDEAALEAIRKCRFTPGTLDGVAQPSQATVRFSWRLNNPG